MSNPIQQNNFTNELKEPDFLAQSFGDGASVKLVQSDSEFNHEKDDLSVFFGIGMVINIVMIISFFLWATRQWKKNDSKKK